MQFFADMSDEKPEAGLSRGPRSTVTPIGGRTRPPKKNFVGSGRGNSTLETYQQKGKYE
jgi:hypothetical protein